MDVEIEAPENYVYSWTKEHELPLEKFLAKYKPSMVQDDGTKPWIWVHKGGATSPKVDVEAVTQEAAGILAKATEKVDAINSDDKIPTRSNKKTGARSKKELREEVQAQLTADLKKLSQEKGFTHGKWMFFAQPDSVDGMWGKIARSLVEGDLAQTPAWLAKVSTSKATDERPQHLICIYLPDLYDKDAVTKALKVLLSKVGLTPSSAKTDLYTHIGVDSKHPSGVRSTIWQVKELLSEDEVKKLRDEFTASQSTARSSKPTAASATHDDPFGDADDEEQAKAAPPTTMPKKRKDDFDDDDEAEAQPAKKAKISAPASKLASKKKDESETEYEDDGDADAVVEKPVKKPALPKSAGASGKPGASRLGKIKSSKTKYL